ncbi:L domain-like protein [Anaeromyces robustus]|uniref:L domain-like protein n=1 Tax=Anaeromyces robustus TaxID=1754192 RepID=A0A1Y1XQU6_9FUNG|nr:L domain-like protein [Anaeromyces robustus]|eukprot:ORX88118.1 L domain-like protein [Anaeromyces robustus]
MQESRKVCEAYSLGTSKEDVALLNDCNEFPNLKQLKRIIGKKSKEEQMYSFYETREERMYSVYDEYNDSYNYHMKRIMQGITRFQTLEELTINSWNLYKMFPESIGNLKNLRFLNILNSGVDRIPVSIGNLKKLERLAIITTGDFLKKIGISDEEFHHDWVSLSRNVIETLPDSIGNLKNLKELNLAFSWLRSLPVTIGNLENLEQLDLRGTYLESFPETIGNLKNLEQLDLRGTYLESFPESMKRLRNLKKLDLRNIRLDHIPDFIWEIPSLEDVMITEELLENFPEQKLQENIIALLNARNNNLRWSDNKLKSVSNVAKLRINDIPFYLIKKLNKKKVFILY